MQGRELGSADLLAAEMARVTAVELAEPLGQVLVEDWEGGLDWGLVEEWGCPLVQELVL